MIFPRGPLRAVQGWLCASIAYPIAERMERRFIREKREELRHFYRMSASMRRSTALRNLIDMLHFASVEVPYYRDLFKKIQFDPASVVRDVKYLEDVPFLTKEIIREQSVRLLSRNPELLRHHVVKTGGSTGPSCHLYYDQDAADYAAAVVLYARERIGKTKSKFETHFACRFPHRVPPDKWTREDWKCLAMNRTNVFFGPLTDPALENIWLQLKKDAPFLAHAHPSTMAAIADFVERKYGKEQAFEVFESSGEILSEKVRQKIRRSLSCAVVNRYGLAEFGVIAYELSGDGGRLEILQSEGWAESVPADEKKSSDEELVFTGFRNRLMPLIRYRTGDLARVQCDETGVWLTDVIGRTHDIININAVPYPTHHVQDILDHQVRGVKQFQFDVRADAPILKLVLEPEVDPREKVDHLRSIWPKGLDIHVVAADELATVGRHGKFRYVIDR